MGCSSCGSGGSPKGCQNNGHCDTGGCNKMNTFDWLTDLDLGLSDDFPVVEVSFKKGARKEFFNNPLGHQVTTGDLVVVDAGSGYDIGQVSLSGELVRMQMKKKNVPENRVMTDVLRIASHRDLEKLEQARSKERDIMIRARVIARTLDLDMKIGDVEYQGDQRKATFYYTANGRVDFRELVRMYAKEFRIKIEMRQIGSRQESARIGGIGSCGRELCCSTWLSDFKSVSTSAARYQSISLNQSKLSGQCGRLKCCLNYELDTYMDALKDFPKRADYLKTKHGKATMIKMDIFKGIMYYITEGQGFRKMVALEKDQVKKIQEMNKNGEFPEDLLGYAHVDKVEQAQQEEDIQFADVTGEIELPSIKKKRRRPNKNRAPKRKFKGKGEPRSDAKRTPSGDKKQGGKSTNKKNKRRKPDNRNKGNNNKNQKKD